MLKQLQEKFSVRPVVADPTSPPPPLAASTGCPSCGSTAAWLDRYGGGPHCLACRPPVTRSLVGRIIDLAEDSSAPHAANEAAADREFSRNWIGQEIDGRQGITRRDCHTPDFTLAVMSVNHRERRQARLVAEAAEKSEAKSTRIRQS